MRTIGKLMACAALVKTVTAQDLFLEARQVLNEIETMKQTNGEIDCGFTFETASKTVSNQGKFAVWHEALQALFYVDSPAFTSPAWQGSIVRAYKPSEDKLYEVYRCDTCTIGSVMPRKAGGVVLAVSAQDGDGYTSTVETMEVDPISFKGGALQKVADIPRETKGKFNNGNCDPHGRLWLGTFDYGKESEHQGKVWVVENTEDGVNVRIGFDQLGHPNGLVWNNDGTELLFSRTFSNKVFRYKYSVADGTASDPVEVVAGDSKNDLFDSICGFSDGSFLVTEPGFSKLKHYSADGSLKCSQQLPGWSDGKFVASCAFGSGDLYVPTGRNGGDSSGPYGWLYRVKNVAGGIVSHVCDI